MASVRPMMMFARTTFVATAPLVVVAMKYESPCERVKGGGLTGSQPCALAAFNWARIRTARATVGPFIRILQWTRSCSMMLVNASLAQHARPAATELRITCAQASHLYL